MNEAVKNLFAIVLLVFSGSIFGAPEYRIPSSLNDGERGDYIPRSSYEILGVAIDSSTLENIKSKLGSASTYKGHHTASHICYVNGSYMVEFSISSLGFGYDVTQVDQRPPKCGATTEPIKNGLGIKVGMSKSDVALLIGMPSKTRENGASYTYWVQELPSKKTQDALRLAHKIPSSESLWLDVYSNLSVSFKNGSVSQFSVHTTETY